MMQRRDATARPHADVAGDGRHGGTCHGRVGVKTAEGMEMPFGRPDGLESVLIGEFRAFQQQIVLVAPDPVVVAPIEQGKVHSP